MERVSIVTWSDMECEPSNQGVFLDYQKAENYIVSRIKKVDREVGGGVRFVRNKQGKIVYFYVIETKDYTKNPASYEVKNRLVGTLDWVELFTIETHKVK